MKKNRRNSRIRVLLVVVLAVSLGYALLATTLKINGTSIITKQTWNVYWANPVVTEGSKSMTLPTITQDTNDPLNTKVSWEVTFTYPGEFYEFTIDAVNAGSIDAKIAKIENNIAIGDVEIPPKYINYTATYADGTEPSQGDVLPKATNGTPSTKKYKIRIEYDGDYATSDDINKMPDEGATIEASYVITYLQPNVTIEPQDPDLKPLLARIAKNPDTYRNQEQDPDNLDIGIDDQGNIINLDWWVDKNVCSGTKVYFIEDGHITLGASNCAELMGDEENYDYRYSVYTMATSSEQLDDGNVITPIPAYIYMEEEGNVYPVSKIQYIFGNQYYHSDVDRITKMPDLPKTVKTIGPATFCRQELAKIELPEGIENIEEYAFYDNAYLSGNILLPHSLKKLGEHAIYCNYDITSITVPRTADISDFTDNCDRPIKYY